MSVDKIRRFEQYQDMIARLYPELASNAENEEEKILSRTFTFQVTDACNLACTYCYQINKGTRRMKIETAKKAIDLLLDGNSEFSNYITPENSPAIVIEFIGGEPFLEIELIEQICDYFIDSAIEKCHPWALFHCFSICSNGVLYFDERVQQFLNKYKHKISFSITIDGNKKLHDSCRIFPDGKPSYDLAIAAAKDWIDKGGYMGSKITIAPNNLTFLYDAIVHMIDLGYYDINANCVYEKGWELYHAKEFYSQLIKIGDYLLKNNCIENNIYCSLFEYDSFKPKPENDLTNWCGGTGFMLSVDPDGYFYPCIRYMESSLGEDQLPLRIGHVDTGIAQKDCEKKCIQCLEGINRRTQSTDECFYCPIADGCSWCSAYNYQEFGTPDIRATYICDMHKARSLANVYLWNKYYIKIGSKKRMIMHCPKEWAVPIIGIKEFDYLLKLSEGVDERV